MYCTFRSWASRSLLGQRPNAAGAVGAQDDLLLNGHLVLAHHISSPVAHAMVRRERDSFEALLAERVLEHLEGEKKAFLRSLAPFTWVRVILLLKKTANIFEIFTLSSDNYQGNNAPRI